MSVPTVLTNVCNIVDAELDRQFESPSSTLSQQARRHIGECARCGTLYKWMLQDVPSAGLSPDRYGRIQEELRRSLKPVPPRLPIRVLAARFAAVFLLFGAPAIGMMGLAGLHEMGLAQMLGMIVVLAFGVALLSLSLAWQMIPGSLQRIAPAAAISILAAGFLFGIILLFPWQTPEAFVTRGWQCFRACILMAVPAAVMFGLLVRRGVVLEPGRLGGTLGAIAGLLGAAVLQFTCSEQKASHLLVWHGGALLVSIVLGVAIGHLVGRLIRPRA